MSDDIFLALLFGFLGALLGSFANVVIYRLPKGESVVRPRSRCGACGKPIAWYDNVPIFSWFFLRGKCRSCNARYSFRYPFVEFLMAALFASMYLTNGLTWVLVEYLILSFGLVVISFIDLDHFIIPDVFSLSGIVIGLAGAALNPERTFSDALLGVLIGGGFLWAIAYVYSLIRKEEGLGGGDIKLLAWMGAVLGWQAIPFTILTASLVGSVIGIVYAIRSKEGLKTALPFGPYLALGAFIFMMGGRTLAFSYLKLFFPWVD